MGLSGDFTAHNLTNIEDVHATIEAAEEFLAVFKKGAHKNPSALCKAGHHVRPFIARMPRKSTLRGNGTQCMRMMFYA